MYHKDCKGFTLIESGIAIVIVALIAGGVLAGRSLVRSAEMRSVATDFTNFRSAFVTFRERYNKPPGDLQNATSYWGAANAVPATCRTTNVAGEKTLTCDGDGNGLIDSVDGGSTWSERYHSWRHLVNEGLISGNYSGVAGPIGKPDVVVGVNAPGSKIPKAGWQVGLRFADASAGWFPSVHGHFLVFGRQRPGFAPWNPALSPMEALLIDKKIDDGRPGTGGVVTQISTSVFNPNCATTDAENTAEYYIADTNPNGNNNLLCALILKLPF
jgi:prepilin-type N-terminal cleavage/methylation domain-containing protein